MSIGSKKWFLVYKAIIYDIIHDNNNVKKNKCTKNIYNLLASSDSLWFYAFK